MTGLSLQQQNYGIPKDSRILVTVSVARLGMVASGLVGFGQVVKN